MKNIKTIRILLLATLIVATAAVCLISRDTTVGKAAHGDGILSYDMLDSFSQEFSTHLPIIVIQTDVPELHNKEQPPESVVWLFDGNGENRLTDTPTEIFYCATAHYRGVSSYFDYPKKSIRLNLYNHQYYYEELEYSFFGLGAASGWVLRTPYADKALLRDWFAYEMAATVLYWQPRGAPVQLFVQDGATGKVGYEGVYFLCEAVDAGETRLDIGPFSLDASDGIDAEGGGYLFQRDRGSGNYIKMPDDYNYRLMYPSESKMSPGEDAAFKHEVAFYHELLTRTGVYEGGSDDDWDHREYIDVQSLIDYYLIAELIHCADAGNQSTFMYRTIGGKLITGPVWDSDLSLGNYDYAEPYLQSFRAILCPMNTALFEDKQFVAEFADRWRELRGSIWTDDFVLGLYDSMAEYLAEPAARNAVRWPEIYDGETYVIYNPEPYVTSWEEEIVRTRTWLVSRLEWLDENIPRLMDESVEDINESSTGFRRPLSGR